jgi:GT2 family glycosyltransferase
MRASGINAVRTYTVPPRWLLDLAQKNGLRVLVGLAWEQHVAFLDDATRVRSIHARVREDVRKCAGHPAVLGYAVGNEIPASIVRWHGPPRVERFIESLYHLVKDRDPSRLVTYVNYPTTEYLQLPFLDLICFNVYLEAQEQLEAYLARLQNLAGEKPLLLAELGLDSRRNGTCKQADVLSWQLSSAFAAGCAGAFVFAWTDEWHRGGAEIEEWDFGLTNRERIPKPALTAVRKAYAGVPFPPGAAQPRVSVIVCSYNGARTIRECCEGLLELDYSNYEVIVVDDGSRDTTAAIATEYGFRVIRTMNRGLSHARNVGMRAATGEILAYIDDDTRPDPHWLTYLAETFQNTSHAAVGGPNLAPPEDGTVAECVANAPGNPTHVLFSDTEAEHIPGCNMAIRKSCLEAIGGFDPQFRIAGDDVDVCWRLQERGWTIGFHPAAVVWHHRRNSLRAYWKQQTGYGNAEALLQNKWHQKYNAVGHFTWAGRVYGKGLREPLRARPDKIRYGTWGSALFQSVYQPAPGGWGWLPLLPEWYLVISALAGLTALGLVWQPLFGFGVLLVAAMALLLGQAARAASLAHFDAARYSRRRRRLLRSLTFVLHLVQPLARLWGRRVRARRLPRVRSAVARRVRGIEHLRATLPFSRVMTLWREKWQAPEERLETMERALRAQHVVVVRGNEYARWDIKVRAGLFGTARLLTTVEEHGAGKQLIRCRLWQQPTRSGFLLPLFFLGLAVGAAMDHVLIASALLGIMAFVLAAQTFWQGSLALQAFEHALEQLEG